MKRIWNQHAIAIMVAVYIIGGMFSYGYCYRSDLAWRKAQRQVPDDVEVDAAISACFEGVLWPFYWPMHLSRVLWEKPVDN